MLSCKQSTTFKIPHSQPLSGNGRLGWYCPCNCFWNVQRQEELFICLLFLKCSHHLYAAIKSKFLEIDVTESLFGDQCLLIWTTCDETSPPVKVAPNSIIKSCFFSTRPRLFPYLQVSWYVHYSKWTVKLKVASRTLKQIVWSFANSGNSAITRKSSLHTTNLIFSTLSKVVVVKVCLISYFCMLLTLISSILYVPGIIFCGVYIWLYVIVYFTF